MPSYTIEARVVDKVTRLCDITIETESEEEAIQLAQESSEWSGGKIIDSQFEEVEDIIVIDVDED